MTMTSTHTEQAESAAVVQNGRSPWAARISVDARIIVVLYLVLAGLLAVITVGWLTSWHPGSLWLWAGLALGSLAWRSALRSATPGTALPSSMNKQGLGQQTTHCLRCLQPGESWSGTVLDQMRLGLLITDADGHIEYANESWETLTSRSRTEALGQSLWGFLHPEDAVGVGWDCRRVAHGELPEFSQEVRLLDARRRPVWVMFRARPCALATTRSGKLAVTLEEITRRKRLDEQLRSTRHYVNTLLSNVPGMVYRCRYDPSYTMEFISDGCLELTGYDPDDLIENRRIAYASLIHPEDRAFVWTQVQVHVEKRAAYQVSYRITDAAGRLRWVWEQGRGVYSSHGELLAVEGFITDVSERKGAEERAKRKMWFEARTGLTSKAIFEGLLSWSLQLTRMGGPVAAVLLVELPQATTEIARMGLERFEQALTLQARRLVPAAGAGAVCAYLGHHQFAVLTNDFRHLGQARVITEARDMLPLVSRLARDLLDALQEPVRLDGQSERLDVVVGITLTSSRYSDSEALLASAQQAAKAAAALGSGHCEFAEE
jgi:PAS domain S-box-containing protein